MKRLSKIKTLNPKLGLLLVFIFSLLTFWACPKPPDEVRDTSIHIELTDTWTTSLSFEISVDDTIERWSYELVRNDSVVKQGVEHGRSIQITDTHLEPNRVYSYIAYFRENNHRVDSTATFNFTTMDTTSHDFTWIIDTLGIYGSWLNDVHIIDENNIWAVGRIIMDDPDSSYNGTGKETFNAVHWDGSEWEVMRIVNPDELYSIFYFNENDIWVTNFGFPIHFDGIEWTLYHIQNMGLDVSTGKACWGTSSDNMYFVGINGGIVHYDGSSFTIMESGTDFNLYSVSGTSDGEYVFTCGANRYRESIALQIRNQQITTIWEGETRYSAPAGAPFNVQVFEDTAYFSSELSLWKYNYIAERSSYIYVAENYMPIFPTSIFINSPNDIFLSGTRSEFVHYNGISWHLDLSVWGLFGYTGISIDGMDAKGDFVVRVGDMWILNHAVVLRGYR